MGKRTRSMMMVVEEEEDRISKLPNFVIIHILSFLPTKDVVRTCLLSKRWKLMWYFVPKLSFSNTENHFQEEFFHFVDKCLEHRNIVRHFVPESMVTSFELKMYFYDRSLVDRLDKWLAFAVDNKLQKINLCLGIESKDNQFYYYRLPKTLVLNAKHLTSLELSYLELDSRYSFSFPSLKSLSLLYVQLADSDVVEKLLLGSPSLESLQLCRLRPYPDHLHIHNSSIKFLQITLPCDTALQIEVINLESLELYGVPFEKTNFSVCKAIRNLVLFCDFGSEESPSLEYLISNLHQLENLTLASSNVLPLRHLKISNHHLKSLRLRFTSFIKDVRRLRRVIIEAPKLASFRYKGNIYSSISIQSSNLLDGNFIIVDPFKKYDSDWFIDMMNFLVNLNCSWNMLSMHIDSEKALIFPEKMKNICRSPLVNLEHLRVFTNRKLEKKSHLKESMLWACPSLMVISIKQGQGPSLRFLPERPSTCCFSTL
ncbi:FBD-associated F-box protein At5g56370-like [Cannabis sativa]|uniref:FBD-associated F-box protein At5g56370-like n=1 Tax=Cannabis sativa TaxID=3483 RepID=UPI0029CA51E4|nr:FBD-associated F-box protein At5g56370-like [Cannabis sativa]